MIGYWFRKLADALEAQANRVDPMESAHTLRLIAATLREVADA